MNSICKNTFLTVIVLYETNLNRCLTYKTLLLLEKINFTSDLIIYNNSPEIKIPQAKNHIVINAETNEMLSGAYNFALNHANKNNYDWLLLLDQDTELTDDYFEKLYRFLSDNQDKDVVAVVPFLTNKSKIISPNKLYFKFLRKSTVKYGINSGHIVALNSLSLLRTDFMNSIGGFSSEFPLDMLDYWYYLQFYRHKKRIYVLDTALKHNLSIYNYDENITEERYDQLLKAERKYTYEFGIQVLIIYKFRLLFRFLKQIITLKNKRFAYRTIKSILK